MSVAAIFVGAIHRFHILLMRPHKLRRHFADIWAIGETDAAFLIYQKPNMPHLVKNVMAMDNFDISAKSLLSFNLLRLIATKCYLFAHAHT